VEKTRRKKKEFHPAAIPVREKFKGNSPFGLTFLKGATILEKTKEFSRKP